MNNKIIEVLDYLGEKIGLAIDWTAENVYPQVIEFMGRYRTYEIVTDIIWILIVLGCCFGMYLYIKKIVIPAKIRCKETREDNLWFEYWSGSSNCNIGGTILTVFLGCITFVAVIIMFVSIEDLVKWIVIPEMQFYEVIKSLVS
jgi:hypothetical protein